MLKNFRKKAIFYLAIHVGNWLVRLSFFTSKNRYINKEIDDLVVAQNRSIIYALWHGQLLGSTYMMRNRGIYAMVGYHRDAEMIAQVLATWDYFMIRGSSRDRGKQALKNALRVAGKTGSMIGITCDGPIGPFRESKPGPAIISNRTGAVIVPLGFNSKQKIVLSKSWDNFYVPLPFSKNILMYGEPIYPENFTGDNAIKDMVEELDNRLNDLQESADNYFPRS